MAEATTVARFPSGFAADLVAGGRTLWMAWTSCDTGEAARGEETPWVVWAERRDEQHAIIAWRDGRQTTVAAPRQPLLLPAATCGAVPSACAASILSARGRQVWARSSASPQRALPVGPLSWQRPSTVACGAPGTPGMARLTG